MDLLAISYRNIWPFREQLKTVFFDKWKFLVKAPIWSWKSFLFFDWPIFALYKYSNRNILNSLSKEWYIKILLQSDWEIYFIVRNLKKSKVKESCSSKLFKIWNLDIETFHNDQTNNSSDLEEILKNINWIQIEEVVFKNENDLQQTLSTILPPREVFLNTVFLMQDSDNIFELAPAERLVVLKNVFNLLWIDEAKEIITENRKEINYKIKALSETSKYDEKLTSYINRFFSHIENLKKSELFRDIFVKYQNDLDELSMIKDKIKLNELDSETISNKINAEISIFIENKKELYQKIYHEKEAIKWQFENLRLELENTSNEQKSINRDMQDIEDKIKQINQVDIQEIKNHRKTLQTQVSDKESSIKKRQIQSFLESDTIDIEIDKYKEVNTASVYVLIQEVKNYWKLLSETKSTKEAEIKNLILKNQNEKDKIIYEIEKTNHNKLTLENMLNELEWKLNNFKKSIETQEIFMCEKISWNCPFIKVINKKTFEELEKQHLSIEKEYNDKKTQIESENFIEKLKKLEEEKNNLQSKTNESEKINSEIEEINKKIWLIKTFLQAIEYKTVEENYDIIQKLQKEINQIEWKISVIETEQNKTQEYKLNLEWLKSKLESTQAQKDNKQKSMIDIENQIKTIDAEMEWIDINQIKNSEKLNNECIDTIKNIKSLIIDFKSTQIEIKKMKEDESILNDLYQIFSKEILLIALRDNLPILTEIINAFLSQVVEYQISLNLNEDNPDRLELEAKISDDKWTREIKSLSGWQKVILKLVRMLAICSYMKTNILFLDETINNLDPETIWKVADMISDFVKQKSIKLYVVTHSQHIQNMDIRDKTIEII